jgi:predicted ATP-grasp superfamily ATP-dependent carboligase
MAMRFLKGVKYTGIGELEFKRDERDGEFKLIELNARSWLQNSLAARAGIDTAYLQYLDLTGRKLPELKPCLEGIRWVDLLSDIPTFWVMRERGEISISEWIRSWMGAEVHAYGALDDLKPVLLRYEYGKGLAKTIVYLFKGEMERNVPKPTRRSK